MPPRLTPGLHTRVRRAIARVDGFCGNSSGGFSGGTLDSGVNMLENPQILVRRVSGFIDIYATPRTD